MLNNITTYFSHSFKRKLLLFNISLVFLTTVALFLFLRDNFQTITNFSLAQNTIGMEQTVKDYLTKYAQEKATSTWLQLQAAQDNLSILGRTAQKIIDHDAELTANPTIFDVSIFQTELAEVNGALSSAPSAPVDALIPPPLAADPQAQALLANSALLNLSIDAIYEANANNAFIYFVGNPATPVTRAYPNIHLAEALGDGLDLLFWQDYFPQNVDGWPRWYTDPALQDRVPSPITLEPPYMDAAGQGMIVTMFYPLWNKKTNEFAGAVGADITLNSIIENVLSIQVARTGFAFLMNGQGEVIAMPEAGHSLFDVNFTETQLGSLSYYIGNLNNSDNSAVQTMAMTLLDTAEGVYKLNLNHDPTRTADDDYMVAFASLPPLSDHLYQEDRWRIAIVVPETEIFEVLNATDTAIRAKSTTISAISLALVVAFLMAATLISRQFSNRITRDLRTLALAAGQVSAKNYQLNLNLKSQDEIGQLGQAFEGMAREIQGYISNLEARVLERTLDLRRANEEIIKLNERLKDENVRLSAELDVARQLQMMVLPPDREIETIPDLDIACYMRPADEVGGDYYDVVQVDGLVFMGIGDVTGHGLQAGVIMLMAQTALLTLSQSGEQNMNHILSVLNRVLYQNIMRIRENKNMTLAVLRYCNQEFDIVGQHEAVIICRTDGQVEVIDTIDLGFPVGLEDDIDEFISSERFRLTPGDVMLLYTDGVTEAENGQREMFGLPNLIKTLVKYHQLNAKEILSCLVGEVYTFIDTAPIYDDISMLVVKQK